MRQYTILFGVFGEPKLGAISYETFLKVLARIRKQ